MFRWEYLFKLIFIVFRSLIFLLHVHIIRKLKDMLRLFNLLIILKSVGQKANGRVHIRH